MIELLVMAVVGFTVLVVVGVLAAGLSLIFLPFKIMGWMIKGVGLLLFIPVMLLFGFIGLMVFGVGMLMFLLPFLPLALLAWLLWKALRRSPAPLST